MSRPASLLTAEEIGRELMRRYGEPNFEVKPTQTYIFRGKLVPTAHIRIQMGGARKYIESLLDN
jgi:hypothetical protein